MDQNARAAVALITTALCNALSQGAGVRDSCAPPTSFNI